MGREHPRHQRPPVAVYRRGAAQRRQVLHHRSGRNRTARLADRHYLIHPGSDLALALGLMHVIIGENLHDADYVAALHRTASSNCASACSDYTPRARSGAHRHSGRGYRRTGARVRHHASGRHPAELRHAAQRARRPWRCAPIALLPALTGSWKDVGGGLQLSTSQAFQFESRRRWSCPICSSSPLGREARIVNMSRARQGAERCWTIRR